MSIIRDIIRAIIRAITGPMSAGSLEVRLTRLAATKNEKLDWRHSIVDLLKLVGEDSSLEARKRLAQEEGYTGELNGSAEMNIWLHKKVMDRLASTGLRNIAGI